MRSLPTTAPVASEFSWVDEEVVELSLLLPTKQAQALVKAAAGRGISAGQLVRQVTQEFLRRDQPSPKG